MTKTEYKRIKQYLDRILEDISGNPDWTDAAECLAANLNTDDKRTLTEGIYEIERGYRTVIVGKGTKIKIFKKKPQYEGYRCRDCAHCQRGKYAFSQNQWWESAFCNTKPKTIGGDSRYFYSTNESNHACELFEKKN